MRQSSREKAVRTLTLAGDSVLPEEAMTLLEVLDWHVTRHLTGADSPLR